MDAHIGRLQPGSDRDVLRSGSRARGLYRGAPFEQLHSEPRAPPAEPPQMCRRSIFRRLHRRRVRHKEKSPPEATSARLSFAIDASQGMRCAVRGPTRIARPPVSSFTAMWHPGALKRRASLPMRSHACSGRSSSTPFRCAGLCRPARLQSHSSASGSLPTHAALDLGPAGIFPPAFGYRRSP